MTADSPTLNGQSTIDPKILESIDPLFESWHGESGNRFYRLSGPISKSQNGVYAYTEYTREIDSETGETIENEQLEQIGDIQPTISIPYAVESRIHHRLKDDNPEMWDEHIVEDMVGEFEGFLAETRLPDLINHHDDKLLGDSPEGRIYIRIDSDNETGLLEVATSFDSALWTGFLWALKEELGIIRRIESDEYGMTDVYSLSIDEVLSVVPSWRIRGVENENLGVFSSALSPVEALMESPVVETQKEIAEMLSRSEPTVSEQVNRVEELKEQARWTSRNRL